jgi:hypothetical protein
VATAIRHFVELKGCGPDDPAGLRTTTVLNAYLRAQATKEFRELWWQRLGRAATACAILAATTRLLSLGTIVTGFGVLAALAGWAAYMEWRAARRLAGLLAELPPSGDVRLQQQLTSNVRRESCSDNRRR